MLLVSPNIRPDSVMYTNILATSQWNESVELFVCVAVCLCWIGPNGSASISAEVGERCLMAVKLECHGLFVFVV